MPESHESSLKKAIDEALKGKRFPMPKPTGSGLPLNREIVDILDALGGMLEEKQSIQNILRALELTKDGGMFCDRCSNPLGVQVKMVPTADGPILELILACTVNDEGKSCDDQNMVFPLTPEKDEEDDDD